MGEFLFNKKVLFIGIGFYDYDRAIIDKLKDLGFNVSYFWSSISDVKYKILKKLYFYNLAENHLQNLRKKEIQQLPENNDIVFIIKGENLTQEDIDTIKLKNPNANFILYFWDDLVRIKNKDLLLYNFNNIWSFDPDDCVKYGFRFRPLFFRDDMIPQKKDIYLSSIGWCHSSRLDVFRKVAGYLKERNKTYILKLYTGIFNYYYNRFITHKFSSSDRDLIVTKPVEFNQTIDIMSRSRFVLDLPHQSQKGLTIRTIEALRCGCHLLTTNKSVIDYPDISKHYYTLITNELNDINSLNDLATETSTISEKYSLKTFLTDLFEINDQ